MFIGYFNVQDSLWREVNVEPRNSSKAQGAFHVPALHLRPLSEEGVQDGRKVGWKEGGMEGRWEGGEGRKGVWGGGGARREGRGEGWERNGEGSMYVSS